MTTTTEAPAASAGTISARLLIEGRAQLCLLFLGERRLGSDLRGRGRGCTAPMRAVGGRLRIFGKNAAEAAVAPIDDGNHGDGQRTGDEATQVARQAVRHVDHGDGGCGSGDEEQADDGRVRRQAQGAQGAEDEDGRPGEVEHEAESDERGHQQVAGQRVEPAAERQQRQQCREVAGAENDTGTPSRRPYSLWYACVQLKVALTSQKLS